MATDGKTEVPTDALHLLTQRIDQSVKLLTEMHSEVRKERDFLKEVVKTMIDHLEQMEGNWQTAERHLAGAARIEGSFRESLGDLNRAVDRLPGKRYPARGE